MTRPREYYLLGVHRRALARQFRAWDRIGALKEGVLYR